MKSPKNQKSHISASSLPISEKRLTQISDRYLQMIYDTTPVEVLLKPMKGNSRKYRKYIIQLGKLDKRSPRVREKIVPFAVELYKEGDKIYRDIALFTYQAFLGQVCKVLEQLVGKDMEAIKKVCKYTPEAMADLLLKYEWICLKKKQPFRPNALWMVLEVMEMPYPEGKQHQAESLLKKKEKEAREAQNTKEPKEPKEDKESGGEPEESREEAPAEQPRKARNGRNRDKGARNRNGRERRTPPRNRLRKKKRSRKP